MRKRVDLLVTGNLIVNICKRGGVKPSSYIAYANEREYESENVIQGDYILQGEDGVIAATGGITFIREGV